MRTGGGAQDPGRELLAQAYAHGTWATLRLIAFCRELPLAQQRAGGPGTYGPIDRTLRHLVTSERRYLARLSGEPRPEPRPDEEPVIWDDLAGQAEECGKAWQRLVAEGFDPAREIGDTDESYTAGTVMVQALHHGNDHRTQVCSVLGTLGVDPPEIDAWAHGEVIAGR